MELGGGGCLEVVEEAYATRLVVGNQIVAAQGPCGHRSVAGQSGRNTKERLLRPRRALGARSHAQN
jgi:hypothetical protein